MTKENHSSYHHGDLQNALITAGLEILAKEGDEALSLRKVARRAGVSHAAPYRHFADKEALLFAIAEEGYQKLREKMQQAAMRFPAEPHRQLIESGWAYIQFALQNPSHLRVMFRAYGEENVDSVDSFGFLVGIIKSGQAVGSIAPGEPQQLALTAWATVHGLALLLIEDRLLPTMSDDFVVENIARACIQTLYAGLANQAPV
jgi:AcrR family transcriptional regulator